MGLITESAVATDRTNERPLQATGQLPIRLWRATIQRALSSVQPGGKSISPFGFEVLRQKRFLNHQLRNFYIYIFCAPPLSQTTTTIAEEFATQLIGIIKEERPLFYSTLRSISLHQSIIPVNDEGWRTLYIRTRAYSEKPIEEYADFLLSFPSVVAGQYLRAAACYNEDPLARRYFLQLFLIYMATSGRLNTLNYQTLDQIYSAIRRLTFADISENPTQFYPVTKLERELHRDICTPVLLNCLKSTERDSRMRKTVEISVSNFHGSGSLSRRVPLGWYQKKKKFVIDSYRWASLI
jgi:hypothetical protein